MHNKQQHILTMLMNQLSFVMVMFNILPY